jgi:hypothetical protein
MEMRSKVNGHSGLVWEPEDLLESGQGTFSELCQGKEYLTLLPNTSSTNKTSQDQLTQWRQTSNDLGIQNLS